MPMRLLTGIGLGNAPLRIAVQYGVFGLLWIWLSDWALNRLGFAADYAFLASALKGTGFVGVTAAMLFWLVRRCLMLRNSSGECQ